MNKDIQDVHTMLAPSNPHPPGSLAGSGRDATGRAAFARVTTDVPPRRKPRSQRTSVRLVAVGGLAVAIAAGTTITQTLGGTDEDGKPRQVLPGLPAGSVANAQVVLAKAADAAQNRPFTAPRPDQWVYDETRYRRAGQPGKGEVLTPKSPMKTQVDRRWTRADGTKVAFFENGRLLISPTGGGMPPIDYASLAKLPRDADALLAWARKNAAPRADNPDAELFNTFFSMLLNNGVMPPKLEAAIYRALAKINGVTVNKDGRALAISMAMDGWLKEDLLLDPATYAYRGHRTTVTKDHSFEGGMFKKGLVESHSTRLATGITDRPGQRP